MTSPPDSLWNLEDAAAYLRVPPNSIYRMTGKRAKVRIPHIKLTGLLRFRKRDIDRWLELMSVSDLEFLEKARTNARRSHGNYPQDKAP